MVQVVQLLKEMFSTRREDYFDYLQKARGKGTVRCLCCCSSDIWSDGFTLRGVKKYQCQRCYQYFNDLTVTIFDNHKFPLEEMFNSIKEMEAKSTRQISLEINRDYDSVQRFVYEIQHTASKHAEKVTLEGIVEFDKIYVYARRKGKKKNKSWKRELRTRGRGTWNKDKSPVMAMVKKGNTLKSGSK